MELSNYSLSSLPKNIKKPKYNRKKLSPGIVHIGVGNFHRAHQSWYLHRLFETGIDYNWAIVGAGVREFDVIQRERLIKQDCLTTLIELKPDTKSVEIVGSMIDYEQIDSNNNSLIERMTDPSIRIVSLTVTESGYYLDPVTNEFDNTHADILHDAQNPNTPRTAFGAIIAALKQRYESGIGPFTGLSCDNLQGNGNILRNTIVSLATMSDPLLATWIDENCSFPNSMVDCIVPATGDKELELVQQFGIDDKVPVTHENFRQWVIEDDFCAGRPHLENVGVTFTSDVHSYEVMKIRILNAGHQFIANAGELLSIKTISGCMDNTLIKKLLYKVHIEEVIPHVSSVPNVSPRQYVDFIAERFSNPAIVDTVRRVSFDGSARHPGFVLPIVRQCLSKNMSIQGLALIEAIWARMCYGTREDGSLIESNDPNWDNLKSVAKEAKTNPKRWIEQRIYDKKISTNSDFLVAFDRWLLMIWSDGLSATIKYYLSKV